MEKEILFSTAIDKNGTLAHINNAEKGMDYYCPVCKKEFILRKSGKTGKGSRRAHFAHNELSPNCTPEGVLHYSFKRMMIDLLEKHKVENKPFIISWACDSCGYGNSVNLLGKATSITKEHDLGECQPDIALLDEGKNVLGVIEIVVTHKPEESALQYYRTNKIVLVQINLNSDEDLNRLEEKARNPDVVDLCLSFKCINHDQFKIARRVKVIRGKCEHCPSYIPRFEIEVDSPLGKQSSRDFTEDEMKLVKSKFNNIEIRKKTDTKEKYPIFVCENCKRIRSRYNRFRL